MSYLFELDALGTHWWIEFSTLTKNSKMIEGEVRSKIARFEQDYSRFLPTSFVSILNDKKQLNDAPKELVDMLDWAIATWQKTDGIFNITVGAKLEQTGYGKQVDINARVSDDLVRDIIIQGSNIFIAQHIRLDFGGFGKGWLVDAIADILDSYKCGSYVINGGGDIRVKGSKPEELALEHPYDSTLMIGVTTIANGALAASSPQKRSWVKDGKKHHHLVNAKDSEFKVEMACGFVTAKTALIADVLSTVLLLCTPSQRETFLKRFMCAYLQVGTDLTVLKSHNFVAELY